MVFINISLCKMSNSEQLDIFNLAAKSTQHVVLVHPKTIEPKQYGSGCIAYYKEKFYLLSVAHVTNLDDFATCIDTGVPQEELKTKLYSLGGMFYIEQYRISNIEKAKFEELNVEFEETLDICFTEIKENVHLLQKEMDFGAFKIESGNKVCLNLELAGEPSSDELYIFFGNIKQDIQGILLKYQPTFKYDLKFKGTYGFFHLFNTPEIIEDGDDYSGCSGAPILDSQGKLVGLVSSVNPGSKSIFAFSISRCRGLLDAAINSGAFN